MKKGLLITVLIFALFSCNKEDNDGKELLGKWINTKLPGTMGGGDTLYIKQGSVENEFIFIQVRLAQADCIEWVDNGRLPRYCNKYNYIPETWTTYYKIIKPGVLRYTNPELVFEDQKYWINKDSLFLQHTRHVSEKRIFIRDRTQ